jgi:hypothetical protein
MFDNPLVYLFLFEVALMQLIEFFLWRNLKDKSINKSLSRMAVCTIILQQITLMIMIPNLMIRYSMLLVYVVLFFIYIQYRRAYNPIHYHTSIGKNGHLSWEWMNYKGYENIWFFVYLSFYILPLLAIQNIAFSLLLIIPLLLSFSYYFKYNTFGTMWCWSLNLFLLYFIVDILIIKPYYEYNGLC